MNPAVYDLGSRTITVAVADVVITAGANDNDFIEGLAAMQALAIEVAFVWGGGGIDARVIIETSLDHGANWIEIARFLHTTASRMRVINLSALTPIVVPVEPAALPDDTALNGVLGERIRARLVTTGVYSNNTSVAVRAIPR